MTSQYKGLNSGLESRIEGKNKYITALGSQTDGLFKSLRDSERNSA